MIKKLFLFLSLALFGSIDTKAQLPDGSIAPDFIFTDMNGQIQELYSYLNAGQSVVIEVSATWCPYCWDYHNSGNLQNFYTAQGPSGTNKAVVLFIEGDRNTSDANIRGYGTNTLGDWTKDTPYPICNPYSTLADFFDTAYKISYYPTMYLICATTRKTELVDIYTTAELTRALDGCPVLNFDSYVSVFPYLTKGRLSVDVNSTYFKDINVKIYNIMGQALTQSSDNNSSNVNEMNFDLSNEADGMYFIEVQSGKNKVIRKVMLHK